MIAPRSPPVATGGLGTSFLLFGLLGLGRRCDHVAAGDRTFQVRERPARCLLDDLHQLPPLQLGERPALDDLDGVAQVRLVLLVVGVADRPPLDELAVLGVTDQPLDLDPAGLGHLVAGDDALQDAPARGLGRARRRGAAGLCHYLPLPFLAAAAGAAPAGLPTAVLAAWNLLSRLACRKAVR